MTRRFRWASTVPPIPSTASDSFACAIHALAPTCENCGLRIVGHGLEKEGTSFWCEHCAEVVGVTGLRDRIGAAA
jgi:hypothetical protein